jgi:type II secretory pathway component PulF
MSAPEKDQAMSFAKAIAQHEFGRFYWDERSAGEVRRSLASAMVRIKAERRARAKLLAKAKK